MAERGRPTDCTPKVTAVIVRDLRAGLSISSACAAAGIDPATYHRWVQRGDEGPPFSDFRDAVTQARSDGVRTLEQTVLNAATQDWRAAAWALERKAPGEWSKRTEISGPNGAPVQVAVDLRAEVRAQAAALTATDLGIPADVLPDGEG